MTHKLPLRAINMRLNALDHVRTSRPLTVDERAEYDRLDIIRFQRIRRLPDQIAATEAKLARLKAEMEWA